MSHVAIEKYTTSESGHSNVMFAYPNICQCNVTMELSFEKWKSERGSDSEWSKKIEKKWKFLTSFCECNVFTQDLFGCWITLRPKGWLKQFGQRFYIESIVHSAGVTIVAVDNFLLNCVCTKWWHNKMSKLPRRDLESFKKKKIQQQKNSNTQKPVTKTFQLNAMCDTDMLVFFYIFFCYWCYCCFCLLCASVAFYSLSVLFIVCSPIFRRALFNFRSIPVLLK